MADDQTFDLGEITPEQFAQLVAVADDGQIVEAIHAVGTQNSLDRIFEGFQQRFKPDNAAGVEADIQFVVKDQGEEHPYVVSISNGACTTRRDRAASPRVTLTMDLLPFVKLVGGQAEGPMLFMSGKLKISGDLMFSLRIMSFFDRPKAA